MCHVSCVIYNIFIFIYNTFNILNGPKWFNHDKMTKFKLLCIMHKTLLFGTPNYLKNIFIREVKINPRNQYD